VTCPQCQTSRKWKLAHDRRYPEVMRVEFGKAAGLACPCRWLCTTTARNLRQLPLRPQAQHQAIPAARERQTTPDFKKRARLRTGIAGTLSQGMRAFGLRQAKMHLQHLLTATAINVARLLVWLAEVPRCKTRTSRLAALAA
jgi:transposase